ncbi:hypothetical protein Vafri_16136, partial [Volvox africanus]
CYDECCKDIPKHKLEKPYCDKHDNEYKDYCHAKCEFKRKDWKEEPRECRRRRDDHGRHDRHDRHDHDDRHDRHDHDDRHDRHDHDDRHDRHDHDDRHDDHDDGKRCYEACRKHTPKHKLGKPFCDKDGKKYNDYCQAKCECKEEPKECRRHG